MFIFERDYWRYSLFDDDWSHKADDVASKRRKFMIGSVNWVVPLKLECLKHYHQLILSERNRRRQGRKEHWRRSFLFFRIWLLKTAWKGKNQPPPPWCSWIVDSWIKKSCNRIFHRVGDVTLLAFILKWNVGGELRTVKLSFLLVVDSFVDSLRWTALLTRKKPRTVERFD